MKGQTAPGDPHAPRATADADSRRGCNARCPRCGRDFDCGVADDAPCACATVTLDDPVRQAIARRYSGCLCLPCLRAVSSGAEA